MLSGVVLCQGCHSMRGFRQMLGVGRCRFIPSGLIVECFLSSEIPASGDACSLCDRAPPVAWGTENHISTFGKPLFLIEQINRWRAPQPKEINKLC
jgi:hypothetical protein